MRLVLLLTAVGGVALVVCELLGPLRFAELAGGRDDGAAVYGTVLAISFGAAAVGAMAGAGAAPAAARLHPGHLRAADRCSAPPRSPCWPGRTCWSSPALGFAAYYVAHGSTWPLLSAVLHTRVDARPTARPRSRRCRWPWRSAGSSATSPSRRSPAAVSIDAAFVAVAVVVLVGAVACLRLPARHGGGAGRTLDEAARLLPGS